TSISIGIKPVCSLRSVSSTQANWPSPEPSKPRHSWKNRGARERERPNETISHSAFRSAFHKADISSQVRDVRSSNRPFRVNRFQTIHHYSVDVAHGLVLLFGIGTRGPSIMGFEDEVEQSFGRPCRQTNGRSKRTCELTSSIVPRGTSFHRSVELECASIG